MPDHDFRNLFRTRHDSIREADRAVAQAKRAFGRARGDNGTRWTLIAAGKCERAAAAYLKAGLGLLAKQQYAAASRNYSLVGDRERTKLNQDRWAAVPTYWEDDGHAANKPTRGKEPHDGSK
jgi:hypothetical protein